MRIDAVCNQQNKTFKSRIHATNTLGYAVNTAIKNGDKGFFNAIKHLANDGLKRDIFIDGMTVIDDVHDCATAVLRVDDVEHFFTTSVGKMTKIDGFQLLGKNTIKLVKKLASETGNISNETLNEKSSEKMLVKEGNELYNLILQA